MAAAGAAQIALLVREGVLRTGWRVKQVGGLGHGPEQEGGGGAPTGHLHPHAGGEETDQLLAGEGERVAGAVRQGGGAQQVVSAQHGRRCDGSGAVQQPAGSSAGEAGKAEAVLQAGSVGDGGLPAPRHGAALLRVVDEVAARPIGAEADGVESAAQLGLVLGVTGEAPQLVDAVGELALVTILAGTVLLEGPAQLRLVAAGVHLSPRLLLLQQALTTLGEGAVPKAAFPGAQHRSRLPFQAAKELVLVKLGVGQSDRVPPRETPACRGAHRLPVQQAPADTRGAIIQHLVALA